MADLVVGLDFGTSCSKIVIRSPFLYRAQALAIPFGELAHSSSPYLLPTVTYEDPSGGLGLAMRRPARRHADLKVALMESSDDALVRARAAAYLGRALRLARVWLLETQAEAYGHFRLRWALNLGIPSAGYDDDRIRAAFVSVARGAWILSLLPEAPTAAKAMQVLEQVEGGDSGAVDERGPSGVPVAVVPEIAAEVVGYARSHRRDEGLHVMLDVGASTIDLCGFVLHAREGEDHYELLTAVVERLGLHELHRRRVDVARVEDALDDLLAPIPESARSYVGSDSDEIGERLSEVDAQYVRECTSKIMEVLMALRRARDPNSNRWQRGLPLFVAGGGCRFGLVRDAIDEANRRFTTATRAKGLFPSPLAALETLRNEDVPEDLMGRLAVAYGLSFDSLDIGEIRPPREVADIPPPRPRPPLDPITKDQV